MASRPGLSNIIRRGDYPVVGTPPPNAHWAPRIDDDTASTISASTDSEESHLDSHAFVHRPSSAMGHPHTSTNYSHNTHHQPPTSPHVHRPEHVHRPHGSSGTTYGGSHTHHHRPPSTQPPTGGYRPPPNAHTSYDTYTGPPPNTYTPTPGGYSSPRSDYSSEGHHSPRDQSTTGHSPRSYEQDNSSPPVTQPATTTTTTHQAPPTVDRNAETVRSTRTTTSTTQQYHYQQQQRSRQSAHPLGATRSSGSIATTGSSSTMMSQRPVQSNNIYVFVNAKSGGQQGNQILQKLQDKLGADKVFPLIGSEGGPDPGLKQIQETGAQDARCLVCGGDGSVGWVLSRMDALNIQLPVGILPLGTGNDLARTLNWGPGYKTGERWEPYYRYMQTSHETPLDRWQVKFGDETDDKIMVNYFSVGVDASIAHKFHTERETNPDKFKSRTKNKIRYGMYGMQHSMKSQPVLSKILSVKINGEPLEIPKKVKSLIFLNINSFAGGTDIWGTGLSGHKASISDYKLEVVGVSGAAQLGRARAGISKGKAIGTAQSVEISWAPGAADVLATQVDGEPWMQPPTAINIAHHQQSRVLHGPHRQ